MVQGAPNYCMFGGVETSCLLGTSHEPTSQPSQATSRPSFGFYSSFISEVSGGGRALNLVGRYGDAVYPIRSYSSYR